MFLRVIDIIVHPSEPAKYLAQRVSQCRTRLGIVCE